jgi:DNA-binding transcriptional LysR family regulator
LLAARCESAARDRPTPGLPSGAFKASVPKNSALALGAAAADHFRWVQINGDKIALNTFVTIVSVRNSSIGDRLTMEQFQQMPQVVVSLEGKLGTAYDKLVEEQGMERNVFLTTPHFLVVPLLLERHPDLIATVPMELASVFSKYGTLRILKPPIELPQFALSQHWHPRFHTDPAVSWLRALVKRTFEHYREPELAKLSK